MAADGCALHLPPFATSAPCPQPLDALGTVLEGGVLGASDTGCATLLALHLSFVCHSWCAGISRYRPELSCAVQQLLGLAASQQAAPTHCWSPPTCLPQVPGRAHRRLVRHLPAGPHPLLLPARQPAVGVAGDEGTLKAWTRAQLPHWVSGAARDCFLSWLSHAALMHPAPPSRAGHQRHRPGARPGQVPAAAGA